MSINKDRISNSFLSVEQLENDDLNTQNKLNKVHRLEDKLKSRTILSVVLIGIIFVLSVTLAYYIGQASYVETNKKTKEMTLGAGNIEEEYKKLSAQFESFKQKNKELNKQVEELTKANQDCNQRIKMLTPPTLKELNGYKDYLKILNAENKDLRNKIQFLESKLKGEKSPLIEGIQSNINANFEQIISYLPHYPTQFRRIYSAKMDGGLAKNFHDHCDNQGATLVLIKSSKGYTFGGYTEQSWDDHGEWGWKKDPNAFLFSLDTKAKVLSQNEFSIYANPEYGPKFGYTSIAIQGNCLKEATSTTALDPSYGNIQLQETKEYKAGDFEFFTVEDYEVFKVDYIEQPQLSPTWAEENIKDLEDFIESQGIYIRQ